MTDEKPKPPPAPPSGPGLRFVRKPKIEADHPGRVKVEQRAAELLDEWLRRRCA